MVKLIFSLTIYYFAQPTFSQKFLIYCQLKAKEPQSPIESLRTGGIDTPSLIRRRQRRGGELKNGKNGVDLLLKKRAVYLN